MSSPSPITDGKRVWIMTGVGVLKSFDFAGTEIWSRDIQTDYGRFGLNWGYASSPAAARRRALRAGAARDEDRRPVVSCSRLMRHTGKTLWKVERPTIARQESPDSYTTPAVIRAGTRTEIIITGGDAVTAHDPASGKEFWRADILNPQNQGNYRIVASPLIVGDIIIAPSRNNPLAALRPGGSGDVAGTHVAWKFERGPDVPTPVSDGKYLYVVNDSGVVHCLDPKTGAVIYGPERLPSGSYSASPTLADGKIYVTEEVTGTTQVFRSGPKFELLASNSLNDACSPYCLSTVAVSEGQLFIRSSANLWAIGQRKK